ncbi:PI-PLC X domain-containing protein 1 isoform X3 [Canis lupus dingo]|nr:PI-PLC X domain-containing protein 1 isoform X3 [Canis lupus dingo]
MGAGVLREPLRDPLTDRERTGARRCRGHAGWPPMGGQLSASGSFQSLPCTTNADWMSALCPLLWDVPLHHLSIPGSHDTMTYCLNKNSPISQTQSRLLQLLDKVLPCVTRPLVLKWSTTQVLNVTEQLDAGVRYLDLRIAHMLVGSEKNLHFVHMVYTTVLVEDTLTEISEWLESHPREVVILACRNFEGMTEDLHEYLVACIKNIFGDMLCPRGVALVTRCPEHAACARSPCHMRCGSWQLPRGPVPLRPLPRPRVVLCVSVPPCPLPVRTPGYGVRAHPPDLPSRPHRNLRYPLKDPTSRESCPGGRLRTSTCDYRGDAGQLTTQPALSSRKSFPFVGRRKASLNAQEPQTLWD